MSFDLSNLGWMVFSGLALGCDTAVHKGCLKAGGVTVGILPISVINVYSKENQKLADEIVVNKGCLLSEYLPNERIQKHYFIQRNRLQAALSDKVIVLQTGIKGATIHTVNFALKYGKKVFCLSPEDYPTVDMDGNKMLLD